jgi:uncharacterized protein (DUF2062 family)
MNPNLVAPKVADDLAELKREEREVGAILTHMWENTEKLARQELDLGLKEVDIRVDKLKASLLRGVLVGATIYAGVLVLLAAIVLGLSKVMEPWLAALIVGGIVSGIGATLMMKGETPDPEAAKKEQQSARNTRAMKEATK